MSSTAESQVGKCYYQRKKSTEHLETKSPIFNFLFVFGLCFYLLGKIPFFFDKSAMRGSVPLIHGSVLCRAILLYQSRGGRLMTLRQKDGRFIHYTLTAMKLRQKDGEFTHYTLTAMKLR